MDKKGAERQLKADFIKNKYSAIKYNKQYYVNIAKKSLNTVMFQRVISLYLK